MKLPLLLRTTTELPSEWRQDFLAEWNHILYLRARAVALVTLIYPIVSIPILSLIDFKIIHPQFSQAPAFLVILLIGIFIVSAYLLISNKPARSPQDLTPRNIQATNIYLIGLAILFNGSFAVIWAATGLNPPYLIGLFIYSSLFYRPNRRNFILYIINFIFYLFYISTFDFSISNRAVAYISGILTSAFALAIANSLFDSKVKNFIDRRTIEQQAEALKNANTRLSLLANLDGLTQIANRRLFDRHLAQQWQQLGRSHSFLSLLICDVDRFKLFNDTYGHLAGDQCLKQVALAIESCVERDGDLVARYGGEEFAVILPNTSQAGAILVAEKICQAVRSLAILHQKSSHNQVTISIGVAGIIPSAQILPEQLIESADRSLYDAKQNGRDRFSCGELNISQVMELSEN